MLVGITKIQAAASRRPHHLAFNRDTAIEQVFFPRRKILSRYSESDVQLSRGLMGWNYAARRGNRLQCSPALEHQQHLFVRDAEYAETLASLEQAQSQLILIETNRSGKIIRVKAGLNDAVNARGGHDQL